MGCWAVRPGLTNLSDQTDQADGAAGLAGLRLACPLLVGSCFCKWRRFWPAPARLWSKTPSFVRKVARCGISFSQKGISGRAEVPSEDSGRSLGSLGLPGAAFVGNFRFAILRMVADLTTKSFFVVKSVTIRNGAIRSALVDARRRSRCLLWGAIAVFAVALPSSSVLRASSLYNGADQKTLQ